MTPPRQPDPAFPAGDSGAAEPLRRNVAHAQRRRTSVTKRIVFSVVGAGASPFVSMPSMRLDANAICTAVRPGAA